MHQPPAEQARESALRLCTACFCVALLAGISSPSRSATPPPFPSSDAVPPATLRAMPAAAFKMGSLSVKFNETTLGDILAVASTGKIAHQGDAGESLHWLCFTKRNQGSADRIWITSSEMGGERHLVTGMVAKRLASARPTVDCPALPAAMAGLSLDKGIWLDTSRRALRLALGAPSLDSAGWQSYSYQGKMPGPCADGGFDVSNLLTVQLIKERIGMLRVEHVISC